MRVVIRRRDQLLEIFCGACEGMRARSVHNFAKVQGLIAAQEFPRCSLRGHVTWAEFAALSLSKNYGDFCIRNERQSQQVRHVRMMCVAKRVNVGGECENVLV